MTPPNPKPKGGSVFTYEDLDILKRWSNGDTSLGFDDLPKRRLAALLARLEAAESVCNHLQVAHPRDAHGGGCSYCVRLYRWRKAAGKL